MVADLAAARPHAARFLFHHAPPIFHLLRLVLRTQSRSFPDSHRGYVIQPSVGAERLRWVVNHKLKSTLKELKRGVVGRRCNPVGIENYFGWLLATQNAGRLFVRFDSDKIRYRNQDGALSVSDENARAALSKSERFLTAAEFVSLADVPSEMEWFAPRARSDAPYQCLM